LSRLDGHPVGNTESGVRESVQMIDSYDPIGTYPIQP
tara:strand:+ start:370 stop:480 length:111 start_codon:yes stop_codon:yes gene_type:complete